MLNIKTKPNPKTDRIDSNSVHVRNVSFIVSPKYSLNIQNPASLTCEQKILPAPIASTTSDKLASDDCSNGNTIPTDEIADTVVDPSAILSSAAASHAKTIGDMFVPSNRLEMASPTPPSIRICLKVPPPPMIRSSIAIGVIALVTESIMLLIFNWRRIPIV